MAAWLALSIVQLPIPMSALLAHRCLAEITGVLGVRIATPSPAADF